MAASSQRPPEGDAAPDVLDAEALRQSLGLRPTSYAMSTGHPDERPCPPWCWVALSNGEQEHEIMPRHPMKALHVLDEPIRSVASLYPGEPVVGVGDRRLSTATLETSLTRLGSADPVISVHLRQWPGGRPQHKQRLALTLADALELAAALNMLVELANRNEPAAS